MPHPVDHFRIRKPESDLYWALYDSHPERLPNHSPWPIALRPGADDALALTFRDGMLLHRDSDQHVIFTGQLLRRARGLALAPFPAETSTIIDRPLSIEHGDSSLATFKIWDVYLVPTDDNSGITVSATKYEWQIESVHSARSDAVKNAYGPTGELALQDLDGLCRLDVEVLFNEALTLSETSIDGTNAVVEIVSRLPKAEFVARALRVFCSGELCYRDAAYRILDLVVGNQDLEDAGIVKTAALSTLIQFFCRDDDERIHTFARRLLMKLGSARHLLALLQRAIRSGNDDFYRFCTMEATVKLNGSNKLELVKAAADMYLATQSDPKDALVAARKQIAIEAAVDCFSCSFNSVVDRAVHVLEPTSLLPDLVSVRPDAAYRILSHFLSCASKNWLKCAASVVTAIPRDGSTPPLLLTASFLHRLYRINRSGKVDALVDNVITALVPFLPPEHPGPSIYRPASIQQLPVELTLNIFRFLSAADAKAFCRSHAAAFRCLHDRRVASRMLQQGVIRPNQIGDCSAVTVNVLELVDLPSNSISGALLSAVDGCCFDLTAYLLSRYRFNDVTLNAALYAAARMDEADLFAAVVETMTRLSAINALTKNRDIDVFQSQLVLNFLQHLNAAEAQSFFNAVRSLRNELLISVLVKSIGVDSDQDVVDWLYTFLCEDTAGMQKHHHIESLMRARRYPVGVSLKICAERGHEFLERYVQKWPLDHDAVHAALKRQLRNGRGNKVTLAERFDSNIAFLLTHPMRPTWNELLGILQGMNVDDDIVLVFVAAVDSHYDVSKTKSECSADDYAVLTSRYFPRAASKEFAEQTIVQLLGDVSETQLPAILEFSADGTAPAFTSSHNVVANRLFERAVARHCLLAIDSLFSMPILPDQLFDTVYRFALNGNGKLLQCRIVDFINQRGHVDDFADFWIRQYTVPTSSALSAASPTVCGWEKDAATLFLKSHQSNPRFIKASKLFEGFATAFEKRFFGKELLIHVRPLQLTTSQPDEIKSAISRCMASNLLAKEHNGFHTVLVSTTLGTDDCLFLEFTRRRPFFGFYWKFRIGERLFYRLQFSAKGVKLFKERGILSDVRVAFVEFRSTTFTEQDVLVVALKRGSIEVFRTERDTAGLGDTATTSNYVLLARIPVNDLLDGTSKIWVTSERAAVNAFHGAYLAQLRYEANE